MCRSPFFVYVELFTPGQNWQINQSTELLALKDQRLSNFYQAFQSSGVRQRHEVRGGNFYNNPRKGKLDILKSSLFVHT